VLSRPNRLALLAPAWVLYTVGALLVAGYITVAVAHGLSERAVLVTIQRVGPAPSHQTAYWLDQTFHHSHTVATYQDLGGVNGMSWQFWISYHGCSVTPRGALRLTLFKAPHSESDPTAADANRRKTLYSHTLVEHRPSGSTTYEFPGSAETYFFIRVDVPSHRGCTGWQYGATTN
jgi:hypothetical protein